MSGKPGYSVIGEGRGEGFIEETGEVGMVLPMAKKLFSLFL